MANELRLTVNGTEHDIRASGDTALLYVLRNDLGLNGPQFGCGVGRCGACTVLIDGNPVRSCNYPVSRATGQKVTTLEGIGSIDHPHPVQQAFLEAQAAQCGYCSNGMIMTTVALLAGNPRPEDAEVRKALDANLCRCGSHLRILRAVVRAAELMATDPKERQHAQE